MFRDIGIMNQVSAMAKHAAERHNVIARNIANADTPGFKAQEMRPFDATLVEAARRGSRVADRRMTETRDIEGLDAAPNGNNVGIEDQMTRAVDAQGQHMAAVTLYRKSMELLRLSLQFRA